MSDTPRTDAITKIGLDRDMDEIALITLAEQLERELQRAVQLYKAELTKQEELEGRCCPEDYGVEEWIGVLKQRVGERDVQIANLTAALNAMNQAPQPEAARRADACIAALWGVLQAERGTRAFEGALKRAREAYDAYRSLPQKDQS